MMPCSSGKWNRLPVWCSKVRKQQRTTDYGVKYWTRNPTEVSDIGLHVDEGVRREEQMTDRQTTIYVLMERGKIKQTRLWGWDMTPTVGDHQLKLLFPTNVVPLSMDRNKTQVQRCKQILKVNGFNVGFKINN